MEAESLSDVERKARMCRLCPLWKTRKNVVFGEGSEHAMVLFVGEAPGRMEDETGRPFVGPAGKILDEMLWYAGLERKDVYITSILKCRPPGNRKPEKEEIKACSPYLDGQIGIIRPKIICPLGNVGAKYVMRKYGIPFESIGKVHGKRFVVPTLAGKVVIIPLYHPAVVLYNADTRDEVKEDFDVVKRALAEDC